MFPDRSAGVLRAPERPRWPQPAGIGLAYLPSRPDLVSELLPLADYLELSPELFGGDTGSDVELDVPGLRAALALAGDRPVVVHGLELSIGSAHGWNESALQLLDGFLAEREPLWHSEHLNFLSVQTETGSVLELGLPLPLPFTAECAELVAGRADAVIARYRRPFLLENSANYLPDLPADPGWDEATFLTALTERSGCGLLLDLFNLWTNCVNHGLDATDLLGRIPLDRVIEVHVAGGTEMAGLLLDSHSAAVPEPVWSMLRTVRAGAPNLAGVTVEVLDIYADSLGAAGIAEQLRIARWIWDRR
jgi:uncharacterized protein (UPF0276 family)